MLYYNNIFPGQKLLCQDLASLLNTSTTPVIKTLKIMGSSNLVHYIPNKNILFLKSQKLKPMRFLLPDERLNYIMLQITV